MPDLLLHRWFFGEFLSAASRASPGSEMWLGSDAEAVLPTVEINLSMAMEVFTNVFESLLDLGVWDLVGSQILRPRLRDRPAPGQNWGFDLV